MTVLFRRLFRLCRLALHMVLGLFQAGVLFRFYSLPVRDRVISHWSAKTLKILGIKLAAGIPPEFTHGAMLVANHISWLDVFVIHAAKRVHFVSKHEVRSWPVVGWLAERAGTLFIQRAKKTDTARINQEMDVLLRDGAWVAVFPEGTSTDGRKLLRFLPSLFQPAVDANLPVVPAALQYQTPQGSYTDVAAYIDNVSFGKSLWRIAGEKEIIARLTFGMPIRGDSRRQLADATYHEIATFLGFAPLDNPPETLGGLPASGQ
jgi:1-acyl-sn-glycerol-3-phosphate acyltransferase